MDGRNRRDADYRAKKLIERGWTCRACDNRAVVERDAAAGHPALEGSEKQIAWAATLRERTLKTLDPIVSDAVKSAAGRLFYTSGGVCGMQNMVLELAVVVKAIGEPAVREAVEAIRAETDARFWIDGREEAPHQTISAVARRLADEARAMSPEGKAEAAAQQEAMAEATLRPPEPVSETIAELSCRDGRLVARYDERTETFNTTVKGLGYVWDPAAVAWVRRHNSLMMGTATDRLAETAHELIAAGIVVALYDPEARAKAIDRSYEPEHRRWVSLVPSGANEGKLRLTWGRDEDLYSAFRSLPGATYRDKACLVPATSRDAVIDFVEAHGFRITPGAKKRMDEVMAQRQRGIVVDAVARPKAEPVKAKARGDRPDPMDIPEHVGIDDDLVDHD
ncbi:hypothetical protein [Methylobacterium sp. GXS13]|uniref:hypothetical protein n=1 Tax=Methylobacterium sp. GXS13 TaxID=1730094 RepID=UPI00128F3E1B|nr:hypothetical protein [Methylobacterium sp. GXS13]